MQTFTHTFLPHCESTIHKLHNITHCLETLKTTIRTLHTEKPLVVEAVVFGRIQGVGFRPFVANLAHILDMRGFVCNESDCVKIVLFLPCGTQDSKESYNDSIQCATHKTTKNIQDSKNTIESVLLFFSTLFLACDSTISLQHIQSTHFFHKDTIISMLQSLHIPKNAYIESLQYSIAPYTENAYHANISTHFSILSLPTPAKTPQKSLSLQLPLDVKVCETCLQDMGDTQSRFYNYAFSACTNCGARYSIIEKLPYDRIHTSMKDMPLCESCKRDYSNMNARRFHAEPISCNACPIEVRFYSYTNAHTKGKIYHNENAIKALANALQQDKIILYKGLGGFAYITNARSTQAIKTIRAIKMRPTKPFVVMAHLETLRTIALLSPFVESVLLEKSAPIVLAPKHSAYNLSPEVSALETIGVMIPYTAMLCLLFSHLPQDFALIYTSANNKGDMIATELDKLNFTHIMQHTDALYILDYAREIRNAVDDSIVLGIDSLCYETLDCNENIRKNRESSNTKSKQIAVSKEHVEMKKHRESRHNTSALYTGFSLRAMRVSRGFAPLHLRSTMLSLPNLCVAFGAMQKSSLAFGKENSIVVSPYLGDLFTPATIANFRKNFDFFTRIYGEAEVLVADKHPRYISTQIAQEIAQEKEIPFFQVAHHHAHLNALLLESQMQQGVGVIFDGNGLGEDGTIWGGEFLSGSFKTAKRELFLKPFRILGGEKHVKDSKRLAYSYALCNNRSCLQDFIESCLSESECNLLQSMYKSAMNAPLCSSVGRLFDIVGFLLGLETIEYEGQSGEIIASFILGHARKNVALQNLDSLCRALVDLPYNPYAFYIENNQIDISPCIESLFIDMQNGVAKPLISLRFIDTLIACIMESLRHIGTDYALFGGGVFANYVLCMRTKKILHKEGIQTFFPKIPCNDYSISIGQLAYLQSVL